jgi:protein-tyrosine phosphatase
MAEAAMQMLLDKERPGKAKVSSSGVSAARGYPATLYAIEAVKMWDLDLAGHESRPLTQEMIKEADLIFCMSPQHVSAITDMDPTAKNKTYLLKNFPDPSPRGEAVEDPIGQPLDKYNECFLEIGEYLGKHLPEIVKRIDAKFAS